MTDTTDLVRRLEAGENTFDLEQAIGNHFHPNQADIWPNYINSLDAAVALVERVRPEAYIELSGPRKYLNIPTPVPNKWLAKLDGFRGWGATPAAALAVALLKSGEV